MDERVKRVLGADLLRSIPSRALTSRAGSILTPTVSARGSVAPPITINVPKTGLRRIPLPVVPWKTRLQWGGNAMLAAIPWITVLLASVGSAGRMPDDAGDAEESWSECVSRARCASRCLSLHSVAALSTPLQVATHRTNKRRTKKKVTFSPLKLEPVTQKPPTLPALKEFGVF